jgi:hypothetical protein
VVGQARELSVLNRFFHWPLEFPEVFAAGGFDVVLGNPPWERIKLQEQEFFAGRDHEIANAPNKAARERLIKTLPERHPALAAEFALAKHQAEAQSKFVRSGGRFPLCGRGDINTYAIFAEAMRRLLNPKGRVGCIVPSGIATDDTTKFFFRDLMDTRSLVCLFDFENRQAIFPAVHRSYKFCLLTLAGAGRPQGQGAEFAFFLQRVEEVRDAAKRFTLTGEDLALLNPNTRTCPIFRSPLDAEVTKAIYRRVPVLIDESKGEAGNPWGINFSRMFDMTNDSALFRTREELEEKGWRLEGNIFQRDKDRYLPIYEGKMIDMYDHRSASIIINPNNPVRPQQSLTSSLNAHKDPYFYNMPYLWVNYEEVETRIPIYCKSRWIPTIKRVTASTNERTLIGCILPPLLIENRELAATLISAKQIFGATIIDSALSGLEAEEPIDSKSGSDSSPEPNEYETLHQTGTQLPDQNTSNDHNDDKAPSPREILPSPGRHLVIIRSVKGYLHNFPDYTGPRARIEMEIMEGPDVGKILVDNVSLPHPQESKGMCQRRVRIAYRLGLIPRGTEGTFQINWKPLEGVVCWVDLAYKNFSGRMVHMVDNYELVEYGAHTQPAPPLPVAGAEVKPVVEEYHELTPPLPATCKSCPWYELNPWTRDPALGAWCHRRMEPLATGGPACEEFRRGEVPPRQPYEQVPAVPSTTPPGSPETPFICADCPHFQPNNGRNPRQGWGRCRKRGRGRLGVATACRVLAEVSLSGD